MTCRSDDLPPITLTAREHQALRTCIGMLLRLGIKDNRLTNITSQMSLALKKSARRAETIGGADLLRDFTSNVWSCSRCGEYSGWVAYGNGGFATDISLYGGALAVPVILY